MPVLAVIRLKAQGLPWTELMDAAMVAVHSQQGRADVDIRAACVRAPMHHRMHEVHPEALVCTFLPCFAQHHAAQSQFCVLVVMTTLSVSGACRMACVVFFHMLIAHVICVIHYMKPRMTGMLGIHNLTQTKSTLQCDTY